MNKTQGTQVVFFLSGYVIFSYICCALGGEYTPVLRRYSYKGTDFVSVLFFYTFEHYSFDYVLRPRVSI